MKKVSIILGFLLMFSLICTSVFATRNEDLLNEATKDVIKAKTAKMSADRLEYYKAALDKYQEITKKSDIPNAPYAVQALYGIAEIKSTITGKDRNLDVAVSSLNTIINKYDKTKNELRDELQDNEASLVLKYVAMAKVKKGRAA